VAPWGDLIVTENDHGVVRIVRRKLALAGALPMQAGGFEIGWHSMPSLSYRVEYSDDLSPPDWRELETVAGATSTIITTCSDTGGASTRFYRVVDMR